ncbi:MAG: SRPBCC family protein [Pseudomonadota bacterium]|nr:SRPBCC family protein [Pseudomonadota bacterium]
MSSIVREDLQTDREIVIERVIAAPRHIVWKAWARQDHIEQWWGPDGFTTTTHERDFRSGGTWRFTMHGPDGRDYENHITFLEIVEGERIVDEHGGEGREADLEFIRETSFADREGGTLLSMRMVFPSVDMLQRVVRDYGAVEGGHQTLARLAAIVESAAS